VPAPQNSAQHAAATVAHQRRADPTAPGAHQVRRVGASPAGAPPVRQPTRQFTPPPLHRHADGAPNFAPEDADYPGRARQFAGIDIEDFAWARQRARRAMAFWVLAVLILTGLVAAAGWTFGTNFNVVFGL
jgi:serine/threonine-protein kinase